MRPSWILLLVRTATAIKMPTGASLLLRGPRRKVTLCTSTMLRAEERMRAGLLRACFDIPAQESLHTYRISIGFLRIFPITLLGFLLGYLRFLVF